MTHARIGLTALACSLSLLTACGGGSSSTASDSRTYSATASVGDFLTITVDPAAQTITYDNHTNLQSGTVGYTVDPTDGAYDIATGGGLLKAYEIPGLALVASADNTGPTANATSLVTAVLQSPLTLGNLDNQTFNYMQWRTSQGGMGIGSISFDGSGNAAGVGYWAYGAMQLALGAGEDPQAFNPNSFLAADITADPSGNFLTVNDGQGTDTVFGTKGGFFVVDNPNGSIIGVPQASSGTLDPATTGTYKALAYTKTAAMGTGSGMETGTGSVVACTLTLGSGGQLTVTDSLGNTLASQTLQPLAEASYLTLTGTGELPACPGLFFYEGVQDNIRQEIYLEFIGQAMLFCTYAYDTTQVGADNPAYTYYYGVALKQ